MTGSPPTIAAALAAASARLADAGIATARLDAEVLLRFVLDLDRTALFQRLAAPLPPEHHGRFEALLARRLAHEPVAYLTGQREFMGLPFAMAPGVLIPRPETELLVEWALAWLGAAPLTPPAPLAQHWARGERSYPLPDSGEGGPTGRVRAVVVDVGTGSGAIALSVAAHRPTTWFGRIIGADISTAALRIAARNRQQLSLDRAVALVRGDLLTWCARADLVLANLPYLRPDQVATNPDLAAEPAPALVGGDDGLSLIRRLVADLPRVLGSNSAVALEIDPSQAGAVQGLLRSTLPGARIAVRADLAGLDRLVTATVR